METLSSWPVNLWPPEEPLDSVFQKRLVEYRAATAGVDPDSGIKAMCGVYATHCSEDQINPQLLDEAYEHLTVGTNVIVKKISGVKFIG